MGDEKVEFTTVILAPYPSLRMSEENFPTTSNGKSTSKPPLRPNPQPQVLSSRQFLNQPTTSAPSLITSADSLLAPLGGPITRMGREKIIPREYAQWLMSKNSTLTATTVDSNGDIVHDNTRDETELGRPCEMNEGGNGPLPVTIRSPEPSLHGDSAASSRRSSVEDNVPLAMLPYASGFVVMRNLGNDTLGGGLDKALKEIGTVPFGFPMAHVRQDGRVARHNRIDKFNQ